MAITWENTIKGQFTAYDIQHMKQITGNALKLDDYQSVKTWAGQIWVQVSNGYMPPGGWPENFRQNFQTWMNAGMPESDATGGTMATITWTDPIKGYFKPLDISHMKQVSGGSIDLSDYNSVKTNGSDIYNMVSTQAMPPGNPWSSQWVQNFQTWMNAGYPES